MGERGEVPSSEGGPALAGETPLPLCSAGDRLAASIANVTEAMGSKSEHSVCSYTAASTASENALPMLGTLYLHTRQ